MTTDKKNRGLDDKEQSKLFIDTARKIGADSKAAARADDLMGKLAKMPPEPRKPLRRDAK